MLVFWGIRPLPSPILASGWGAAADDVVTFDDGGHAHALFAFFGAGFDAHYFTLGAHKNVGTMRNFAGEGERQIEFASRFKVAFHQKVETLGGNIAGLAFLANHQLLNGRPDADRQG